MADFRDLEEFAIERLSTRYARERVETSPLHILLKKNQTLKGEQSEQDALTES